jgi:hypothetical protein
MAVTVNHPAFVDPTAETVSLSQMFTVTPGSGDPTYLVLTALDRDEYTAGASGATGSFSGDGQSLSLGNIGGDGRSAGIVFTYQASTGRYYSSTYGYLDQLTYDSSASAGDVTNLSLFGTSNLSMATEYASNANALTMVDGAGYMGSATVVTAPTDTSPVPAQATPDSIAAVADSFVGQSWNMDGCWVLASTIAAEAGTSLPVQSTLVGLPGQANGEWIVAFNGPAGQSGNWQSMVTAGEMVVIGTPGGGGHITTCVSGSGSSAMLVDNIEYVSGAGQVQNPAGDGSSNDIKIAAPHSVSQEWGGVAASSVVIYELDTPAVTDAVAAASVGFGVTLSLGPLFTATDPAGKAITSWQIYDSASTDTLLLNGTASSDHSAASALTAASLASVSLDAGTVATTDTLDVRAFNGSYWGDWQSLAVAITASAPRSPVLETQTPNQTWASGRAVLLALPATTFQDPQGEALTYSAQLSNGQALPGWLSFNAATETFTGTAPATATALSIKLTATDTSGLSASDTFSANVLVVPTVTEKLAADTGWSSSDFITSNPTLTGTCDANAVVTLTEAGIVVGTVTANATGTWSDTPVLADGLQTVVASETNSAGNTGTASLTFTLDTKAPAVTAVSVAAAGSDLAAGQTVQITLTLTEAVKVTGTPTLTLNDGGVASYLSGSGTNALVFKYTVANGQNSAALAVTGSSLPGGAGITDIAGNNANLSGAAGSLAGTIQIDTVTPTVTSVVASPGTGAFAAGKVVTLRLNLNEAVIVTGSPVLKLNDGGTATYLSGSGTSALTFSYTVLAGQNTAALATSGITLPTGAAIKDGAGNAANLAGATASLPGTVVIDTKPPAVTEKLSADTGWSASDLITSNPTLTGTGDANAVVTLTESGQVVGTTTANATGAWTYTPAGLANGSQTIVASETDAAGNTGTASLTFTLDTTPPVVTAIATSSATGDLGAGQAVSFTVSLSAAVRVTGTPVLTLNDGGSASYSGGSGTSTLTFKYTAAAGQNISNLAVTGSSLPSGATITDIAGNAANLSGVVAGLTGRMIVDTTDTRTTIANGTGQTVVAGTGNDIVVLSAGKATLAFNGSNDIAFLGGGTGSVNATIDDLSSGLTAYVLNAGNDVFNGLANDRSAVIDLLGGVGGYASVGAVMAALTGDGHGGTLVPIGAGQAIDFIGAAPTALHAANFAIG